GLFGDDESDHLINAFKYGVYKVTHMRILPKVRLTDDIKRLPVNNRFEASKKGEALQEGMIDSYHHIIINNMDIELLDLEDYRHNFVNLTGFRLVNVNNEFTRHILKDMDDYRENTQLKILHGSSLSFQCALIFDAVYLFALAVKELHNVVDIFIRPKAISL
ncbi:glutamate receptor ionotropic, kainate 2-like, partial [Ruditapes philippinarum]|uniref:glutamate receptor ionotropic, kainate 2-like n=1 Tax=Ruditapes philippinarum TaxID=129788 RepID=UPI00295A783D